jgi:hypothetical protein
MEGLLHWDFSPGLALADQVRRRFGSSVHFSPSSPAKEFFLVVAFSFASFPLSEESVGIALQCCIGGDHAGFRVFKLSDRRFRFSLASNHVGHFIYSLKDRVWPDFVCHFSLYRGDLSACVSSSVDRAAAVWLDSYNGSGSPGKPMAIRPNLDVLKRNSVAVPACSSVDRSSSSSLNSDPVYPVNLSVAPSIKIGSFSLAIPTHEESDQIKANSISFGKFSFPIAPPPSKASMPCFVGKDFKADYSARIKDLDLLEHIIDLRQADYLDKDIMVSLNLRWLPTSEEIFESLGRCTSCHILGHLVGDCPGPFCHVCSILGHSTGNCPGFARSVKAMEVQTLPSVSPCSFCLNSKHSSRNCPGKLFCSVCNCLGHRSVSCSPSQPRLRWVPKVVSSAGKVVSRDYRDQIIVGRHELEASGSEVFLPTEAQLLGIQLLEVASRAIREMEWHSFLYGRMNEPAPFSRLVLVEFMPQATQNLTDAVVPMLPAMTAMEHLGFMESESDLSVMHDAQSEKIESLVTPGAVRLMATDSFDTPSDEFDLNLVVPSSEVVSDVTPNAFDASSSSAPTLLEGSQASSSRPRGRPRKVSTPKVESLVRRCTRNNNEGYKFVSLPDTRRKASVPKSAAPEVLQISEMQRLGVEECHIDLEELSDERLNASRDA